MRRLPSAPVLQETRPPVELEAVFLNRRAFLARTRIGPEACEVYWPGAHALEPQTPIKASVGFLGEPERFAVEGRVASRNALITPGVVLEFRGEGLPSFRRLYAAAQRRPPELGRRGSVRYPVAIPAAFEHQGLAHSAELHDLSRGGAFVTTPHPRPPAQSLVSLEVMDGWFRTLRFTCRVAFRGERLCGPGFGVEFIECGLGGAEWLAQALAAAAR